MLETIKVMNLRSAAGVVALLLLSGLARAADTANREVYRKLGAEVETELRQGELKRWFPACIDQKNGGHIASFDRQWHPIANQTKGLIFQSRMLWTTAAIAGDRPDLRETYLPYVRHGLAFMKDTMWDKAHGGFYWELAANGSPLAGKSTDKHAYGIGFGIYAAVRAYAVTQDAEALQLAQNAFLWLDQKAHDSAHGGYFEALAEDGTPLLVAPAGAKTDRINTAFGCKSMNTHIHLLESFTELYRVWPDPKVKGRIEELLAIILDRMIVEPGCQHMFFTLDYRPLPDLCSYGHDVETAYLLLETAEVLGKENDPAINKAAKSLVDHGMKYGLDKVNGGLFDRGPAYGAPRELNKVWWAQAEALNAFLLMHEKYGAAAGTDDAYFQSFTNVWTFIRQHQLDGTYGGWFEEVSPDGNSILIDSKGHNWKAAYHTTRALLLVSDRLKRLADKTN